jgi:crossover junction endodeoxyribonuclease RusA
MIVLPYPDKALWPNGRAHWAVKAREVKKHRQWAAIATKAARIRLGDSPIPVHIICHPKGRGPAPDRDGIVSAVKSYIDGIADALGINDRHFAAPTVEIGDKRIGQFVIFVGERA